MYYNNAHFFEQLRVLLSQELLRHLKLQQAIGLLAPPKKSLHLGEHVLWKLGGPNELRHLLLFFRHQLRLGVEFRQ